MAISLEDKTFVLTPKQQRLVGYAIFFLIANFDDSDEENLDITEEEFIEEILKTGLVERSEYGNL